MTKIDVNRAITVLAEAAVYVALILTIGKCVIEDERQAHEIQLKSMENKQKMLELEHKCLKPEI